MATTTTYLLLLLSAAILSHPRLSFSLRDQTVNNAAEILANSGYMSMSLTLQLVSELLIANVSAATIFSPNDLAFADFGQPSFSLLQLHFAPSAYSLGKLQSLPFGTTIPTLSSNRSLFVTTLPSDNQISINSVKIDGSPIFDDGSLVVFAIQSFFDPNFELNSAAVAPNPTSAIDSGSVPTPSPILECPARLGPRPFAEAGRMLRLRGYSIMASFLELQMVQPGSDDGDNHFTVFAPGDGAMAGHIGNFSGWRSFFLHHVVPCELSFSSLAGLDDGAALSTFLEDDGVVIRVSRSGNTLLLNGVPIDFPDLYHEDHIVVHGIQDIVVAGDVNVDGAASSPASHDEVIFDEF